MQTNERKVDVKSGPSSTPIAGTLLTGPLLPHASPGACDNTAGGTAAPRRSRGPESPGQSSCPATPRRHQRGPCTERLRLAPPPVLSSAPGHRGALLPGLPLPRARTARLTLGTHTALLATDHATLRLPAEHRDPGTAVSVRPIAEACRTAPHCRRVGRKGTNLHRTHPARTSRTGTTVLRPLPTPVSSIPTGGAQLVAEFSTRREKRARGLALSWPRGEQSGCPGT